MQSALHASLCQDRAYRKFRPVAVEPLIPRCRRQKPGDNVITQLYKVSDGKPSSVAHGQLANEGMIEGWVAAQPDLLGLDVLIIGRQVQTDFGGRIEPSWPRC